MSGREGNIFFTEDENKFREEVREFAEKEIAPQAEEFERGSIPIHQVIGEMGKKGYIGVVIPTQYGGSGKNLVCEMIITEEMAARSWGITGSRTASILFLGLPLLRYGTEAQKQKYLIPLAKGEKVGGMGMTEPEAGSDIAAMQTTAKLQGDAYIINGEKRFTVNGAQADVLLVFAITDPSVPGHRGMSAFIIEKAVPGFQVVKEFDMLGWRGMAVTHSKFDNLRVPKENLLGKENEGFRVAMDELDAHRVATGAGGLGLARAAYEIAVKYSAERKQFGVPIRQFEAISFRIADIAVNIEAAELLTLKAARMIDSGLTAAKESAIAKVFATETAFETAHQALLILGGIGYTKEYPVERYLRDARGLLIGGGTNEILRFLIQREVYKELG